MDNLVESATILVNSSQNPTILNNGALIQSQTMTKTPVSEPYKFRKPTPNEHQLILLVRDMYGSEFEHKLEELLENHYEEQNELHPDYEEKRRKAAYNFVCNHYSKPFCQVVGCRTESVVKEKCLYQGDNCFVWSDYRSVCSDHSTQIKKNNDVIMEKMQKFRDDEEKVMREKFEQQRKRDIEKAKLAFKKKRKLERENIAKINMAKKTCNPVTPIDLTSLPTSK